jgi:hypothetical protein
MSRTLGGRYQLTELLGGGETGDVWQAVDTVTGRPVAVKLVRPRWAADPRLTERLREAREPLATLWHPSIVLLLDVVLEGTDGTALVTDLVDGTDLRQWLATRGPMPPAQAAEVVATVAQALEAAHRTGLAHGDVKMSNILVPPPYGGRIRLTDFAVDVLVHGDAGPTAAGDVRALGMLLRDLVPHDPVLRAIAEACVAPDPAARPSAADLADRLWKVIPELTVAESPAVHPRPAARGPGRRRLLVAAAVLVLAAGVPVAALALRTPPAPAPPEDIVAGATPTAAGVPQVPSGAARHDPQGATEFVKYWFATMTYAEQTGDTTPVEGVTGPSCSQCRGALDTIRAAYADGGSLRGGVYVVRSVAVNDLVNLERPVYEATVDRGARSSVDRAGTLRDTLPALSFANCVLVLEWAGGHWRVYEVTTRGCVG